MEKTKPGDVVFLKSGSPELTIREIKGDEAKVTWVAGDETHEYQMPLICLCLSRPDAGQIAPAE